MRTTMLNHPDLTMAWERYQDALDHAAQGRMAAGAAPTRRSVRAAVGGWLVRMGQQIAGAVPVPVTPRPAGAKMGGGR